jgi:hypothetical protein
MVRRLVSATLLAATGTIAASAQTSIPAESKCQPVVQRTEANAGGCWILIDQPIGSTTVDS